jgi:hypothetical protein
MRSYQSSEKQFSATFQFIGRSHLRMVLVQIYAWGAAKSMERWRLCGEYCIPDCRDSVARQLVEFGFSFGEKNLRRMMQFAEVFPKEEIVVSLIRQLSWTHFIALLPLKNEL